MKKLLLPFSLLLCLSLLVAAAANEKKHIGSWKGEDKGDVGYIHLGEDDYAYFVSGNDTLGGESYVDGEFEGYMKFEVTYSDDYNKIDFNLYDKATNVLTVSTEGIFKMKGKNKMVLALSFDSDERPTEFNDDNSITLTRVTN